MSDERMPEPLRRIWFHRFLTWGVLMVAFLGGVDEASHNAVLLVQITTVGFIAGLFVILGLTVRANLNYKPPSTNDAIKSSEETS